MYWNDFILKRCDRLLLMIAFILILIIELPVFIEVSSIITEKYGRPEIYKKGIFFDEWEWQINATGRIRMKVAFGNVKLNYIDLEMEHLKTFEEASIKKQKKEAYRMKDDPKF